MTAIILVNWNGADDTIACLQSLMKVEGDFMVVVVDNASEDDSLSRIKSFIDENRLNIKVELLPMDDNYGFAKGNNKAIHYVMKYAPENILLLNNDTEVEPDFLKKILEFSAKRPEFRALTPRINFFSNKDEIWDCGGDIRYGKRTNPYVSKCGDVFKGKEFVPITFISGCALFFYPELLDEQGNLFTERFFFGEEDFEFSMRMKNRKVLMACVPASQIYHKVGRSRNKMKAIACVGKYYMYYLNRMITLRMHTPYWKFQILKILYIPKCFKYFNSVNHSFVVTFKMIKRLLAEIKTKQGTSREDFRKLMIDNSYFNEE